MIKKAKKVLTINVMATLREMAVNTTIVFADHEATTNVLKVTVHRLQKNGDRLYSTAKLDGGTKVLRLR